MNYNGDKDKIRKYIKISFGNEYDIEEGSDQQIFLTENKDIISSFSFYGDTKLQELYDWLDKELGIYIEPIEAHYVLIKDLEGVDILHRYFKDKEYVFVKSFEACEMWNNLDENKQEIKDFVYWLNRNYSIPDYVFSWNCPEETRCEKLEDALGDDFSETKYIFKFIKKGE